MRSFISRWKAALKGVQSPPLSIESEINESKILCVDNDKSFCSFLKRIAKSMGIQIKAVHSIKEAKLAINKGHSFMAFIIEGHLLDGSGFELIKWLREKKEISVPIVFISRFYRDAKSYRNLKEEFQVEYVLEKPIRTDELNQLLCKIFDTEKQLRIEKIKIFDQLERLEKCILAVDRNPSRENVLKLIHEVRLIGSEAEILERMHVHQLCQDFENELNLGLNEKQEDEKWFAAVEEFYTQLKFHLQM